MKIGNRKILQGTKRITSVPVPRINARPSSLLFLLSLSLSLSSFAFSLLIEVFSSFPLCPPTTRLMNCMRRNYAVTSTRIFARSFLPSDFFFGAGTGCDVRDNKARKFHGQRNKQPPLSVSCFLVENTLEGRVTLQSWITWQFNIFNN